MSALQQARPEWNQWWRDFPWQLTELPDGDHWVLEVKDIPLGRSRLARNLVGQELPESLKRQKPAIAEPPVPARADPVPAVVPNDSESVAARQLIRAVRRALGTRVSGPNGSDRS